MKKYVPSFELLQNIISKKKNSQNYYYYICIRHHSGVLLLIDKLINILLSHYENDIYIYISTSIELYNEITKSYEFDKLCDYIKLNDVPKDCVRLDLNLHLYAYECCKEIDFKYCIYHTQSEYYCKKMDKKNFYNKINCSNIVKRDNMCVSDKIKTLKKWHWDNFKKNNKIVKYFIDNDIMPYGYWMNGIVFTKDMIDLIFKHNEEIQPLLEKNPKWCQNEIIIASIIVKEYSVYPEIIGTYFEKENEALDVIMNNFNDVKNTIKPIVNINSKLLKYLHETYMTELYNDFLNLRDK